MIFRLIEKTGIRLNGPMVALTAILVLGGILAACSRAQTTTSAPIQTATSAPALTTTSAPTRTTTLAPAPTTTSAPAPTGVSAADFYKANVVTIVVPYGAGGGTDISARLFANYWNEVTGGRMIVVNKPGGGGLLAGNYIYTAKPDGLTIGVAIPGPGLISPTLSRDPAVKFDIKKMNWIMYTNPESYGLGISAKSPYNSMDDFSKAKGLRFGSSNPSSSIEHALIIDLFGLPDARIVLGYSGAAEALLAVAKGEVDAYVTSQATLLEGMAKGYVKQPLLNLAFERSKGVPDVPAVPELLKLSPEQESLLKTDLALSTGQVFWLPPGVPKDRIDFVRDAFDKIAANENYVKAAKTRWPVWVTPTSGKDYAAQMEKNLAIATPERYDQLLKLVAKYVR